MPCGKKFGTWARRLMEGIRDPCNIFPEHHLPPPQVAKKLPRTKKNSANLRVNSLTPRLKKTYGKKLACSSPIHPKRHQWERGQRRFSGFPQIKSVKIRFIRVPISSCWALQIIPEKPNFAFPIFSSQGLGI
jgi:hypothetical protein